MHSCEKKKTNKKTIILLQDITDPKFFNSSVGAQIFICTTNFNLN